MKYLTIIAHTTGGEVRSSTDQVTERDYEQLKKNFESMVNDLSVSFNTDTGWVVIPGSQIHYLEIVLS